MNKNIYNKYKLFIIGLVTFCSVSICLLKPANADGSIQSTIEQIYSYSSATISTYTRDSNQYDQINLTNTSIMQGSLVPLIPYQAVKIIIPQRTQLDSIDVTAEGNTSLGSGYNIEIGTTPINTSTGNQTIYDQDLNFDLTLAYPTSLYDSANTYCFRGYSIVVCNLYPVHYIRETGELYYYQKMTVTLTLEKTNLVSPLFRNSSVDEAIVNQLTNNQLPWPLLNYSTVTLSSHGMLINPSERYDYLIITNETMYNSNGEYTFQDLADFKNPRGTATKIVTVEDILADPYYYNTTDFLFNDTAARIRNFIIDAYKNWKIEYVLLGGNINSIPARDFLFGKDSHNHDSIVTGPSDLYYACLDGTFNHDEDYYWGEPHDGDNSGDVDLFAEVYVGRACVDNSADLSNFVMKTIAYEITTNSYLSQVLQAGEKLDAGVYADLSSVFPSNEGYTINNLYENETYSWQGQDIINYINNGVHIINHLGHSGENYNLKFGEDKIDQLTNDNYPFIYSEGCLAGAFDHKPDCFTQCMTVKTSHGAFAGIWNSRYGFTTPQGTGYSMDFHREFWDAVFSENKREIGRANQDSKEDLVTLVKDQTYRWIYYELNLFGDPQASIKPAEVPQHDFAVTSLIPYNFSHVPCNTSLIVKAYIVNYGQNSETNVSVSFTVDGKFVEGLIENNQTISLPVGGSTCVTFSCVLQPGLHTLRVNIPVNFNQTITDENPLNNALNVTVIAGQDVSLSDLVVTPPLYIGNATLIKASIENLGINALYNVNTTLYIDDVPVDSIIIATLNAGELKTITLSWVPNTSTWNNLTVKIKPVQDEGYYDNNNQSLIVHPVHPIVFVDNKENKDFTSIQSAIDWVGNGDSIYVFNGTYYETIKITKSISLQGENKDSTIIEGNGVKRPVVKILDGTGVTVTGFTFSNSCSTGIEIRTNNNVVSNNTIMTTLNSNNHMSRGIEIYSKNNKICNNVINNTNQIGVFIDSYAQNNTLSDNVISTQNLQQGDGIMFSSMQPQKAPNNFFCIIENNTIKENKYGIYLNRKCNIVRKNILIENEEGIYLIDAYNNIDGNLITDNQNGIKITLSADYNTITNNNISRNEVGLKFLSGKYNLVFNNTIFNNSGGINITHQSNRAENNSFYHNNFLENNYSAYDLCMNQWDNGTTGNYWDDYTGIDSDEDGIGDTPYAIMGGIDTDHYPLMNQCLLLNNYPSIPCTPLGPSTGYLYDFYCFSTTTTDPNGDQVFFMFDFGDNSFSPWIGPYASGSPDPWDYHNWQKRGDFEVRVKAKDKFGHESNWSYPLLIHIDNKAPEQTDKPCDLGIKQAGVGVWAYVHNTTDYEGDDIYYRFDWGDGTWSGWLQQAGTWLGQGDYTKAEHVWSEPGIYEVRVQAKDDPNGDGDLTDGRESAWSEPRYIWIIFDVQISAPAQSICCQPVEFTASSAVSSATYSWHWNFGDQSSAGIQNSSHTYQNAGLYTVTMEVNDNRGHHEICSKNITIVAMYPGFNTTPVSYAKSNQPIYFTDTTQKAFTIVNWTWNFGDGTSAYIQNPTHSYNIDGLYNVTMTVRDNKSNTGTYSKELLVDSVKPKINSITANPSTVGYGYNVTVQADVKDYPLTNDSGLNQVRINITYPTNNLNKHYLNCTMPRELNTTYQFIFNDTWICGQYNYTIWALDNASNGNKSISNHFHINVEEIISVATLKNNYHRTGYAGNEFINLTDPPNPPQNYTLVDRGLNWNKYYDLTNDVNILEISPDPINYQNQNGTWIPINYTLTTLNANHPAYTYGYRIGNDHSLYASYFKPNLQSTWPVAFAYNNSQDPATSVIRTTLLGVGYLDPSNNWAHVTLQETQNSTGQATNNTITYPNAFTGTDVVYRYQSTGMKEDIQLSNTSKSALQSHPPSFYGLNTQKSYLVFLTKLDMQTLHMYNGTQEITSNTTVPSGQITFNDAAGLLRCAMPIHDAYETQNPNHQIPMQYRLIKTNGDWYLLAGCKYTDLLAMQFPVIIDPTITIYTSSNDGYRTYSGTNYTTTWNAPSGVSITPYQIPVGQSKVSTTYTINRGFVFFNTSALPSNAIIDNATLSLYKASDSSATDFKITIQNGQPTYPHSPLQDGDYAKSRYSGNGGAFNTANLVNGYNNITLNSTGLTWINRTSWTKFCLRSSHDIAGTAPTGNEYVNFYASEQGTNYKPKLTIAYRNQSKIKNTGTTDIKGYLLIQVQYTASGGSTWCIDNDTIHETTPRTIIHSQQLGLDTVFNGHIRVNQLHHGSGTYRIYAAFCDPNGNILVDSAQKSMVATWQFTVNN